MMNPGPPPLLPPVPQPEKKGIPPIGWVGIGCGSLLLIAIVAGVILGSFAYRRVKSFAANPEKSTAEFIVMANPDLEKISTNDAAGEMTVRTKKDGKEYTVSYKDLAEGKFSLKDSDGNVTNLGVSDLSEVPAWVPRLPGIAGPVTAFSGSDQGKASGSYSATTTDSKQAVQDFFKEAAAKLGLTNSSNSSTTFNGVGNSTTTFSDDAREISLVLSESPGEPLRATVIYQEK
jgi:hypothetical protein